MSKKGGAVRFNHRPGSSNGGSIKGPQRPAGADRQDSWIDSPDQTIDGAADVKVC